MFINDPLIFRVREKILGVSNQNLKHLEVCWYFTQAELWTYELTKPIDNKLKLDLRAELELGLRVKLMPLQLNWKRTKLWTARAAQLIYTPRYNLRRRCID